MQREKWACKSITGDAQLLNGTNSFHTDISTKLICPSCNSESNTSASHHSIDYIMSAV